MDLEVLKQTLASLDINPDEIENERYAKAFRILFAIIEMLSKEVDVLKAEKQKLRDEINLLKGKQTKPVIRGSKKNDDISSENERKVLNSQKKRKSNSRKDKIEIHNTEFCKVDRSILPEDSVSKGYRPVVIRDIIVKPWNPNTRSKCFVLLQRIRRTQVNCQMVSKANLDLDSGLLYSHFTMFPMFQNPKSMSLCKIWVFVYPRQQFPEF